MVESLVNQLRYAILPGHPPFSFMHDDLYEKAYQFWLSYQRSMRNEIGLPADKINADDFLRHAFINVLVHQGSVVAMLNSTLLDLNHQSALNHSYINAYFQGGFVESVRGLGLNRMGTLENIVSHPEWRSARIGLSLGAVVMALALKRVKEAGCNGAFGAARADAPTARIAYDLGGLPIVTGLSFHDKPTDLIAFSIADLRPHPLADVNQLVALLWASRLDATTQNAKPLESSQPKELT